MSKKYVAFLFVSCIFHSNIVLSMNERNREEEISKMQKQLNGNGIVVRKKILSYQEHIEMYEKLRNNQPNKKQKPNHHQPKKKKEEKIDKNKRYKGKHYPKKV